MIVVDSSAIFAILNLEPLAQNIAACMLTARQAYISTATWVELSMAVSGRLGDDGADRLRQLATIAQLQQVEFDSAQASVAINAARRFGRRSGSPARLNLGDCFTYALAKSLDLPLLFIGDDFKHTDIRPAMERSP